MGLVGPLEAEEVSHVDLGCIVDEILVVDEGGSLSVRLIDFGSLRDDNRMSRGRQSCIHVVLLWVWVDLSASQDSLVSIGCLNQARVVSVDAVDLSKSHLVEEDQTNLAVLAAITLRLIDHISRVVAATDTSSGVRHDFDAAAQNSREDGHGRTVEEQFAVIQVVVLSEKFLLSMP